MANLKDTNIYGNLVISGEVSESGSLLSEKYLSFVGLTTISAVDFTNDYLIIYDNSDGTFKKVAPETIRHDITVSTSQPSGGSDGDIWLVYE